MHTEPLPGQIGGEGSKKIENHYQKIHKWGRERKKGGEKEIVPAKWTREGKKRQLDKSDSSDGFAILRVKKKGPVPCREKGTSLKKRLGHAFGAEGGPIGGAKKGRLFASTINSP